jgi:hypothetical protein
MITVVHTYGRARGSSWPENRLLRAVARIAYHVFQALFFGIIAFVLIGVGWVLWADQADRLALGLFLGVAMLIGLPLSAYWLSTYCNEIRLGDDGFCEFETRRRVVRAHVAELESVKEEVDEDGDRNYYLRLRDGSRLWTCGLADFDDFLHRIEAMNPSVEIKRHKPWRLRRRSGLPLA